METLVEFLNIETEMVEEVECDLQETLEELGIEIEYSMKDVLEKLSNDGDWEYISSSLIEVIYQTAKRLVLEKFPEAEIEYEVAGYCSSFEILNINELEIEE